MDNKLEPENAENEASTKLDNSEPLVEKSGKRKRGRGKRGGKNKNQPKPKINEEARKAFDDRVIIKENASFEKYYRSQSFLEAAEFDKFMEALRQPLPLSFRINTFDMSQANFLKRYVQGPQFNQIVIEHPKDDKANKEDDEPNKIVRLSALASMPWYPNDFAWQMNISRVDLRKIAVLQELHRFIMAETDNGYISRQETVSMIPPLVLDVQWGHNVLDMCAAPGSKTAQLLEYLKHNISDEKINEENNKKKASSNDLFDDGMVVANDVDNKRCYMLVHQSSRLNSPNCVIINQDATKLPDMLVDEGDSTKTKLKFDRVLCDVPCSGDGTARKNVDVWKKWNIQNGNNFHRMQGKILKRGLELLKKDGKIVYSTCSLNPVENEAVIASILRESKGTVVLNEISSKLPGLLYRKGVSNWTIMNRDLVTIANPSEITKEFSTQIHHELFPPTEIEAKQFQLDRCIRVLPHLQNTGAFFVACLQKLSDKLPWEIDEEKSVTDSTLADLTTDDKLVQSNDNYSNNNNNNRNKREPKKRKFKGYKEDPFFFLEPTDPDLLAIKSGFGLGDKFPHDQLVHRCVSGKKRSIYLVSKRTRNFITTNCEEPDKDDFVKIINGGMRLFCRASSEAGFRLCQDGVNEVLPYIKDELKVNITKEDLIALLKARTVGFDAFSCVQRVKDDIKLGSFILIFTYNDHDNANSTSAPNDLTFDIPLVAWRGEYTVSLYVTNTYKLHLAALVGLKLTEAELKENNVNKQGDKQQQESVEEVESPE